MNAILPHELSAFEPVFEHAPISLWIEDFSGIRALFDGWRADGLEDIDEFFLTQPSAVDACAAAIRILAVNRRALELVGARDIEELRANALKIFSGEMSQQHARDMAALWRGEAGFSSQSVNYNLRGERIDVLVNARILPGHETDWKRVIVSVEDISACAPRPGCGRANSMHMVCSNTRRCHSGWRTSRASTA